MPYRNPILLPLDILKRMSVPAGRDSTGELCSWDIALPRTSDHEGAAESHSFVVCWFEKIFYLSDQQSERQGVFVGFVE